MTLLLCSPARAAVCAAQTAPRSWLWFAEDAEAAQVFASGTPAREIEVTAAVNAIARAQRTAYSDWIAGLGSAIPAETWLASGLYARFFQDTAWLDVCRVLYVASARDALAAAGPLLVVCARRGLARALASVWPGARLDPLSWPEPPVAGISRLLGSRWRFARDFLRRRRRLRGMPKPEPAAVLLRSWCDGRSFATDGTYRDEYFGELPDQLRRRGRTFAVAAYLLDPEQSDAMVRAARSAPLLAHEREVPLWRLLTMLLRSLRPVPGNFSTAQFAGQPVGPILAAAWQDWHQRGGGLLPELERLFVEALARRGWQPETVVYPMENQPWERLLAYSVRTRWPSCRLVAYQHSPLIPSYTFYRRAAAEARYAPLPDWILTTSSAARNWLLANGYRDPVAVVGTLRPDARLAAEPRHAPPRAVVVLLSIWPESARQLLARTTQWASEMPETTFIVREHPVTSLPAAVWPMLPNLQRDSGNLAATFAAAALVVYDDTTACCTALAQGIPVAWSPGRYLLHYDPLEEMTACRPVVTTADDLRHALRQTVPAEVRTHFAHECRPPVAELREEL